MTKLEKQIEKFLNQAEKLHFRSIKKILLSSGFIHVPAKGSHQKFKHPNLYSDLIIPVHNHDCKNFYKKQAAKALKTVLNHGEQ